jgi:hypothetical protein
VKKPIGLDWLAVAIMLSLIVGALVGAFWAVASEFGVWGGVLVMLGIGVVLWAGFRLLMIDERE